MLSQDPTVSFELIQHHFDVLADTPEAVAKFRGFILDLAVRGRLVLQNKKDESGAQLVKRILAEKQCLSGEVPVNKPSNLEQVDPEACPFAIPKNWIWARTKEITTYVQRGKSPRYSTEKKVPVIAQKCIQWQGFELHKAQFIDPETLDSYAEDRFVRDGDLLWNSTGLGTLGRILVFKEQYKGIYPRIVADSHVTVIRPSKLVVPDYLFCWFAGPHVQGEVDAKSSGSTKQTELATATVLSYAVPVPPLAEQRRIVAKVEELLALCDELEARQTAARENRTRLVRSAVEHLATSQDEVDFKRHSSFYIRHSQLLFDSVPALRQLLLSLAVQGKLVPQDPNDKPVIELSDVRDVKSTSSNNGKEVPFELPSGWRWTRLGQVSELINGDRSKNYPNKVEYVKAGVPWINTGHIEPDGTLSIEEMHYITRKKFDSLRSGKVRLSDLVYCLRGATLGKTAIISQFSEGAVASSLVIIRLSPVVDSKFMYRFLTSPLGRQQIRDFDNGSAQPNLSANSVKKYWIPVPPQAEQRRIVAKVDELMRWCGELEDRLAAAQTTATALLDATLAKILSESGKPAAEGPIAFSSANDIKGELSALWPDRESSRYFPNKMERDLSPQLAEPRFLYSPDNAKLRQEAFWLVGMTNDFRKSIREIDRKLQGRILDAIGDISLDPVTPKGDTVKPLTGDLKQFWRYRIGDFRLVYLPNRENHQVTLWTFAARGGIYD